MNVSSSEVDFDDLSFEKALGLLEEAVQRLEAGGLSLSEATRTYETGMRLARHCNEMLADTELRVTQIRTAFDEQMRMLDEQDRGPHPDLLQC